MGDEDGVEERACAAYARFPDKCWWKGANAKKPQWTMTTADGIASNNLRRLQRK